MNSNNACNLSQILQIFVTNFANLVCSTCYSVTVATAWNGDIDNLDIAPLDYVVNLDRNPNLQSNDKRCIPI